jgi:hypothetical protein
LIVVDRQLSDDARFNIALLTAHKVATDEGISGSSFKDVNGLQWHKAILVTAAFGVTYHGLTAAQIDDRKTTRCPEGFCTEKPTVKAS